jgi:hypothetical protein
MLELVLELRRQPTAINGVHDELSDEEAETREKPVCLIERLGISLAWQLLFYQSRHLRILIDPWVWCYSPCPSRWPMMTWIVILQICSKHSKLELAIPQTPIFGQLWV